MKKIALFLSTALLLAAPAFAQQQENLDLGNLAAAVTATAPHTAGTNNYTPTPNSTNKGVLCQLHQVSSSGTETTTFAIQSFDAAAAAWTSLITSASITTVTDSYLLVYPSTTGATGQPTLPTGWTSQNVHLPRVWRVQAVVAGSGGPAANYTLGCNLLN